MGVLMTGGIWPAYSSRVSLSQLAEGSWFGPAKPYEPGWEFGVHLMGGGRWKPLS